MFVKFGWQIHRILAVSSDQGILDPSNHVLQIVWWRNLGWRSTKFDPPTSAVMLQFSTADHTFNSWTQFLEFDWHGCRREWPASLRTNEVLWRKWYKSHASTRRSSWRRDLSWDAISLYHVQVVQSMCASPRVFTYFLDQSNRSLLIPWGHYNHADCWR